ncbi:MAG: hypothetical protein AAFR17_09225, partial [Pseudomonadota bacterium]
MPQDVSSAVDGPSGVDTYDGPDNDANAGAFDPPDAPVEEAEALDTVLTDTANSVAEPPPPPDPLDEGTVIATQSGVDIEVGARLDRTFGSEAAALSYARSLDGPAAVLQEGNRYSVYEAEHQGSFWNPFDGELILSDAETSGTPDITDTDVTAEVDNLVAIVTEDDYALRFAPGEERAVIDRVGSPLGPLDGPLQAFGPGLSELTDDDAIEDAFELAMRDTAYAALDAAEADALALQAELEGPGLSEASRAALTTALDNLDAIDAEIAELKEARGAATREVYEDASFIARAFASELVLADMQAAAQPFNEQIAALEAQRSAAAASFPLALRIEDREAFRALSPEDQNEMLAGEIDGILDDIQQTRSNLDRDDLDLWNMRGLVTATADALGLEGEQREVVFDKADWEDTKDTIFAVGEGVLAVGLAVGGFFTGGTTWAGLALLGGSAAVGLHGALTVTDDYLDLGAAENTALDPAQGLAPPGSAPHWGWVAAAWVGVGLDAAAVVKPALTALKGIDAVAEALDAGQPLARETAEAALRQAAEEANIPANQVDDFVRRALPVLTGEGGPPPVFTELPDAMFNARFGATDAEAVTTLRQVDGQFQIEI